MDTERYRYIKNFLYKFPVYIKNNRYREIIVMWKFVIERVYCIYNTENPGIGKINILAFLSNY